jgi:hypothetical protein
MEEQTLTVEKRETEMMEPIASIRDFHQNGNVENKPDILN